MDVRSYDLQVLKNSKGFLALALLFVNKRAFLSADMPSGNIGQGREVRETLFSPSCALQQYFLARQVKTVDSKALPRKEWIEGA